VATTRIGGNQAEVIYGKIRSAGGRLTVPTRTVVSILLEGDGHLTADDLIAEVERRTPGIAPSTIYRVLQRLDEIDVIEHVHSGTGPAFYHLRERGHAHLVCNECGTIIDIPDSVLHDVARTVRRTYDFTVEPHHAALLGRCGQCAS
jgi:Fur family transcriptional regulator, ferric uptake regulator